MDSADEREAEAEVTCCLQKEFQKANSRPFATADAKDGRGGSRCFGAVKLMKRRWFGCKRVFSEFFTTRRDTGQCIPTYYSGGAVVTYKSTSNVNWLALNER